MTNFNLGFDAVNPVRTWVLRWVSYDIEADVAISLMWQVPYAEGDHLI
jgi:hypothetical protein